MDLRDSPKEAAWRRDIRSFIEEQLPLSLRTRTWFDDHEPVRNEREVVVRPGGLPREPRPRALQAWWDKLAARGWIAPAWPVEYGGAGLDIMQQFILAEELTLARAPALGGLGVSMAGPTILKWGTEAQKARHIPGILAGETVWCQGFSEAGAGSDLASLQTRAVRDGDDYVLNGTKLWTTQAHLADWMFMLARTDPDAPKHRGITYLLVDLKTPGITIRPIAAMNGTASFNECHFDNVRVPASNVVGEVNRGWYVGTTTLDFERTMIVDSVTRIQAIEDMVALAKTAPQSTLRRNQPVRYALASRAVEAHVARMLSYRILSLQQKGLVPNHEASMAKLFNSELFQRTAETGLKVIGLYGNLWDRDSSRAPCQAGYPRAYLYGTIMTIAGGTSEIQRTIVANRGLGLPR